MFSDSLNSDPKTTRWSRQSYQSFFRFVSVDVSEDATQKEGMA
jgi:hypothetical protein